MGVINHTVPFDIVNFGFVRQITTLTYVQDDFVFFCIKAPASCITACVSVPIEKVIYK